MKFEKYKQAVITWGKTIGWNFYFENGLYGDVVLKHKTENKNLEDIKWFSGEYIAANKDWNQEFLWLQKKVLR